MIILLRDFSERAILIIDIQTEARMIDSLPLGGHPSTNRVVCLADSLVFSMRKQNFVRFNLSFKKFTVYRSNQTSLSSVLITLQIVSVLTSPLSARQTL